MWVREGHSSATSEQIVMTIQTLIGHSSFQPPWLPYFHAITFTQMRTARQMQHRYRCLSGHGCRPNLRQFRPIIRHGDTRTQNLESHSSRDMVDQIEADVSIVVRPQCRCSKKKVKNEGCPENLHMKRTI